jgi:phosphate transport system substrate-binding protein
MKKVHVVFILAFLLAEIVPVDTSFCQVQNKKEISISGAFALYPMVIRWAEEYKKLNPDVRFDISAGGAGKGIADALSGMVDIGMVSREIYPEEIKKGAYPVAVTKDAVVAVVNEKNPAIKEILATGLKKDAGLNLWITGKFTTWSQAFGASLKSPVHVYTRSDACGAAEMWAKYFGKKQEDIQGVGVYGDPGLAQAVRKDPLGIGFNNIGYAYDASSKTQIKGLKVVPLDLNNNGKVDPDENFYDAMPDLINAIAAGKYPSPPARELYFVVKGDPRNNKVLTTFIRWVLSDGQKFVFEAGYINLPEKRIAEELKKVQ